MNIWYIRYADDSPELDGIWLAEDYQQFFATKDKADEMCESLNSTRRADWDASNKTYFEQWEKIETAYEGVESLGLDPNEVFPYHKREFRSNDYKEAFVVDSIEVED